MFLFLGSSIREKTIDKIIYKNCPNCQNNTFDYMLFREWFDLFYIPIFPIEKSRTYLRCTNCKEYFLLDNNEINEIKDKNGSIKY